MKPTAYATFDPTTYPSHSHMEMPQDIRAEVVEILHETLCMCLDFRMQMRHFRWNARGNLSIETRHAIEEIEHDSDEFMEELAELITALGSVAVGTIRGASELSPLPEPPHTMLACSDTEKLVVERLAVCNKQVRNALQEISRLDDPESTEMLERFARKLTRRLWSFEPPRRPRHVI